MRRAQGTGSAPARGAAGRGVTNLGIAVVLVASAGAGCRTAESPAVPPQVVRVAVARETDSTRDLRLSGTIEAERSTSLSFSVPGTVEIVQVHEGEAVRRGQPLARLAARSYQDALTIAKAKADQAEDACRRLEPMHRNRTIPEIKWVEAETGREQARSALSMAQKDLDDTVLRAPSPGVVARRNVEPGVTAIPGSPAIILVQTRTMLASAPVPETQVAGVKKGQKARVVVAALGAELEGAVRELGVIADPLTRTYMVKIAVANPKDALRVGMVAEVFLRQENPARSVVVPPEAVRVDETDKQCVYVVTPDGRLRRREVAVAGFVGEGLALTKGVAAGERVVISGSPMLADGMTVTVEDDARAARP